MCGIIAVLRRRSSRPIPTLGPILERLDEAVGRLGDVVAGFDGFSGDHDRELAATTALLESIDADLRGPPGVACLLVPGRDGCDAVAARGVILARLADDLEETLDTGKVLWSPTYLEGVNVALVRLRDAIWAVGRDRPTTAQAIAGLARPVDRRASATWHPPPGTLSGPSRWRCRPSTAWRCGAGIRRAFTCWSRTTASTCTSQTSKPCWAPGRATRCSRRWPPGPRPGI